MLVLFVEQEVILLVNSVISVNDVSNLMDAN